MESGWLIPVSRSPTFYATLGSRQLGRVYLAHRRCESPLIPRTRLTKIWFSWRVFFGVRADWPAAPARNSTIERLLLGLQDKLILISERWATKRCRCGLNWIVFGISNDQIAANSERWLGTSSKTSATARGKRGIIGQWSD